MSRARLLATYAGGFGVLVGTLVLIGWWTSVPRLTYVHRGWPPMVANTALLQILSGIALIALSNPDARWRKWTGVAVAWLATAIAATTLAEWLLDWNAGIDQLLAYANLPGRRFPGRPPPQTALTYLLLGQALVWLDREPVRWLRVSEVLCLLALALPVLALLGYAYGVSGLYGLPRLLPYTGMAVHTALTSLVLVLGTFAARPTSGLIGLLTSHHAGGVAARRMLIALLALPLASFVVILGARVRLYPEAVATALVVYVALLGGLLLLLATSAPLERKDQALHHALGESEHWKHFFEHANWGAAISDADHVFRFVNEAFARMHGCAVGELIGRSLLDTFPPELRSEVGEKLPLVVERGTLRFESEHMRKDGSRFPVAIDVTAIKDEHGTLLYQAAYVRDVTEEKQIQNDRARLASLIESSDDAVMAATLDGTIVHWNPAAERMYGFTPTDVVGRSISITVPATRESELRESLARIARGERFRTFETKRLRKDGSAFDVALTISPIRDASGKIAGASAIARDVSERKAAERALARAYQVERRQAAWMQAMVEQMPEPVIVLDADGKVALQNRPALALAQRSDRLDSAGQLLSHDIRYPSGEPVPAEALPHYRALRSGESVLGAEFVIVKNGRHVSVVASATPVRIDTQVVGAVALFQDVSALKEQERQREEWISVVAHDLRQPISTISLAADLLSQQNWAALPAPARAGLERVRKSVDKLARMINDLLDASRLEAQRLTIEREPVNLRALLEEICAGVPELAQNPVRLRFPEQAPWICADRMRIDQIFRNLLSNAGKYGTPGTPVDVAVDALPGAFEITVRNHGGVITREDMAHLFQRFSRSEASKRAGVPGIGLGLYITQGLVQAHGGRVWAESTPGEATTFHVLLPALAQLSPHAGA